MLDELAEKMEKNLKFITILGLKETIRDGAMSLIKNL